ncbi:unnamed protein product, partial [Prorocentrum cordatum]
RFPPEEKEEEEEGRGGGGGGREPRGLVERCAPRAAPPGGALLRGWWPPPRNREATPQGSRDASSGGVTPLNNNSLRLTASRALARQGRGANHTVVIWSGHGGTQGAQRAAALQRTEATRCSANPCMYRGLHGSNNKDLSVPHPCALLRPSACAREPNKKVSTTRSPHNAYSTSHPIPSIGTIHLAHGNRNCYPGGPRTPCFWGCSASLRT